MKATGNLYFSDEMQARIKQNKGYVGEVIAILDRLTKVLQFELFKYDELNPEEQTQDNLQSLLSDRPHIVKQYSTSCGRIYIETISVKGEPSFFKRRFISTDIYVYAATEYEYHKTETKFVTAAQLKDILNQTNIE